MVINQDDIQIYLKDIRKIKVMSVERERELSEMMKLGNLTDRQREKVYSELVQGNLRFKNVQNSFQMLDFLDFF